MMKSTVRELDTRGMHTYDRHVKLFEYWHRLRGGESLRVLTDREPKLIYQQFRDEHKGQFDWDYEKQEDGEWIFSIRKKPDADKAEELKKAKELVARIRAGEKHSDLSAWERKLLKNVSTMDFARIEKEMIEEGLSGSEIKSLCDIHIEFVKDNIGELRADVDPGHPLRRMMDEHKVILRMVDDLLGVSNRLSSASGFDEVEDEIITLENIAKNLLEADKHYAREEKIVFRAVEESGLVEPVEMIMEDHNELREEKKHFQRVLEERESISYRDFTKKISAFAKYFGKEIPDHICKEENIMYPIALKVIPEGKWAQIKDSCDEAGYCEFVLPDK